MTCPIKLSDAVLRIEPFEHFVVSSIFTPEFSETLLGWLEKAAPWKLVETDFYEQYEFSFWDVQSSPEISQVFSVSTIQFLCSCFERVFGTKLDDKRIDITAHKLLPGQRIRVHNDYIPNEETHRLVIQLNRGWVEDMGGLLMLFGSENPEDLTHVITPSHNSAFGFSISHKSFHAVSKVYDGERYTVVYSFYSK